MSKPFPEPDRVNGLFDDLDTIAPRFSYTRLNRRDGWRAWIEGEQLLLKCEFDQAFIDEVKSVRFCGRWDPERKVWHYHARLVNPEDTIDLLRTFGFEFGEDVVERLRGLWR